MEIGGIFKTIPYKNLKNSEYSKNTKDIGTWTAFPQEFKNFH